MGIREIISGAKNAGGEYDDVYLTKKVGLFGMPATELILDKVAGTTLLILAGAFAFRLWRAKGPGKRGLRRGRESA